MDCLAPTVVIDKVLVSKKWTAYNIHHHDVPRYWRDLTKIVHSQSVSYGGINTVLLWNKITSNGYWVLRGGALVDEQREEQPHG
eukprot:scaffold100656_cov32-Attheya_sp.AAC.2